MGGKPVTERIIRDAADVAEGAAWLAKHEPRFAPLVDQLSPLPLRLKPDGFGALMHAILGQQVSVASANATWAKLEAAQMTGAQVIAAQTPQTLRDLGLSQQKARYVQALAAADIDYDGLHGLPSDDVIKTLTAVPGIGAWTAEVYTMFSLGRADVFAPGDLALQEGARMIFGLPARPSDKALRAMAQAWTPWRSVAARIIWAYYGATRKKDGIL